MPLGQLLHLDVTELGDHHRQLLLVTMPRRPLQPVLAGQPVLTRLLHGQFVRRDVDPGGDLAADLVKLVAGLFLGGVALPEPFALAVDLAYVDRELIAHNRPAARPFSQLDALDLRRQLPAGFSHELMMHQMTVAARPMEPV